MATVVKVTGHIGAQNRELIAAHLCRFTRLEGPLVLDLLDCQGFSEQLLETILRKIDNSVDRAELTLVVNQPLGDVQAAGTDVEIVGSVAEALGIMAAHIKQRRTAMLLPSGGRSRSTARATDPQAAQVANRGVHQTNEAV
ncbi:hypothetical protein C6A85_000000111910 [Mycobacterium sp. ITM-2017-0098]|nr:hypothetical protein C6A85_000000111910 [Mycobacterium sp. ITM-2017-0098]